jgi:hypothetical protein
MPNSVMTKSPWATLAGPQAAVAVGLARVGASTGGEENGCGATGFAWHGSVGKGPGGAGILGPIGFFGTRGASVGEPGSPCPALLGTARPSGLPDGVGGLGTTALRHLECRNPTGVGGSTGGRWRPPVAARL